MSISKVLPCSHPPASWSQTGNGATLTRWYSRSGEDAPLVCKHDRLIRVVPKSPLDNPHLFVGTSRVNRPHRNALRHSHLVWHTSIACTQRFTHQIVYPSLASFHRATRDTQVFGKLSCKDSSGSARTVNKTWRDAADAVSPPGSFRQKLYEYIHGKTGGTSGGGKGGKGVCETSSINRDMLPPVGWMKENRFCEISGEEGVELLKTGLSWLEAKVAQQEEEEFSLAALSGVDDGEEIDLAANASADAIQLRRFRPFLAGVIAFCEERGISCGAAAGGAAAAPEKTASPPTDAPFGLRLEETGAAAPAAAAPAAAAPAGSSGPPPTTSNDSRWDGWLVFAAAIALAFSEDRPFLCRCALESVWGTSGLPRTQMIELLSRMYFVLRPSPPARARSQGSTPVGFQAASGVSTTVKWNARGSTRLRNDLVICVCALESYFVRCVDLHSSDAEGFCRLLSDAPLFGWHVPSWALGERLTCCRSFRCAWFSLGIQEF